MSSKVVKFEDLICMERPREVLEEVVRIILLVHPDYNFQPVVTVFNDVIRLFRGQYPGYRKCDILYHDLKHTTDCLLAMARLIHGAHLNGRPLAQKEVTIGMISSLLHDTGYIKTEQDVTGTGAKYTLIHVDRSIQFMEQYLARNGYSREEFRICRDCLKCTGLEVQVEEIEFVSAEHELLGQMLGTADLLGQMADRTYLERLPFLYAEFKEGGVPGFENELDLLVKTPDFWQFTKDRLETLLGGVDRFMLNHFRARWGIERDLYREAIERNIEYLVYILENYREDYRSCLRRAGLMRIWVEVETTRATG